MLWIRERIWIVVQEVKCLLVLSFTACKWKQIKSGLTGLLSLASRVSQSPTFKVITFLHLRIPPYVHISAECTPAHCLMCPDPDMCTQCERGYRPKQDGTCQCEQPAHLLTHMQPQGRIPVKLPLIVPGAPLIFNGTSGNIQGNLTSINVICNLK